MATPFDRAVPSAHAWPTGWVGEDGVAAYNDTAQRPFPGRLPDALVAHGWSIEDYFGQPAACHRAYGVVTLVEDGFMACPRNGRPHTGFPDVASACEHCVHADPAAPEAPCPLASVVSDLVSGPSMLGAGAVALAALVLAAWAHHGWPF